MDPLSISASIAGLVALADAIFRGAYRYAKAAKDGPESIRQLADETQNLAGVLHRLSNLASVLEINSCTNTIRLRHVIACRRLLARVEKKVAAAGSDIESHRLRDSLRRRVQWPFSEKEMKELLADLQRHNTALSLALSADTLDTLLRSLASQTAFNQSLDGTIASIADRVGETLEITTRIQLSDRRQQVLDFFGAGNPQLALDACRRLRHEGTGEWLLEDEAFQRWMTTTNQNLWLSGIPGAGKTVLAGLMIEDLIDRSDPAVGVAFFFCDFKDAQTHTPLEILRSLASQLARQNDAAFDILEGYFHELKPSRQLPRGPSLAKLEDVILAMGQQFRAVYLVVDGIDECGDNMRDVAEVLIGLARRQRSISLGVLSRDERPIREVLEPECIHVEIEAHREDVRLYTAAELEYRVRSKRLRLSNPSLKDDILHVLVDENGGMFRWVKCQLDYLSDLPTDAKRRAALRSLPPTLKETYERILGRLEEKGETVCVFVQRTLQLIYGAKFPLTIRQLCEAVSIEDNTSLDDGCVDQDTLLEYCGSLVRKSVLCSRCNEEKLEFAHFTVGEFLRDPSLLENSKLGRYHVSESRSSKALALSALRYISLVDGSRTPEATGEEMHHIAARNGKYRFYEYATLIWPLSTSSIWDDETILSHVQDLFRSKSPAFLTWAVEFCRHALSGASIPCHELAARDAASCESELFTHLVSSILRQNFTPLHMAAALGLRRICETLMQQLPGATNSDSFFGTPLVCAVWGVSSFSSLRFPLSPEAPQLCSSLARVLNPYDKSRPQLLELLLQSGAELPSNPVSRSVCSLFEKALDMCVRIKNFDILTHLLVAGMEPNGYDLDLFGRDKSRPATWKQRLVIPSEEGFASFVDSWDAFLLAIEKISSMSDVENIQELHRLAFDTGGVTGSSRSKTCYVLDSPTRRPMENAVLAIRADDAAHLSKLLEQSDFDPSAPANSAGATLMHLAVHYCSSECLTVLLKHDRVLPKLDYQGRLPILLCHQDMHADVLRLLLENGCDTSARYQDGSTIWHNVAENGSNGLIRILAEKSTNILDALAVSNSYGVTPLMIAFKCFHEDTVLLLLNYCHGDRTTWCPPPYPIIHAAAKLGSHTILRRLLDIGVPRNLLDSRGDSAFHYITASASLACVRLLKTLAPDPDAHLLSVVHSSRPMEAFGRSVRANSGLEGYLDIFKELLPAGIGTAEVNGKHSWEQFCTGIFARGELTCSPEWLMAMLSQLETTGIFSDFEMRRSQSVIIPFAIQCITLPVRFERFDLFVRPLSKLFELTELAQDAISSDELVGLLKNSIWSDEALFAFLTDKGVNVHQRLEGTSAMEVAFDPSVSVPFITWERLMRHLNEENVNTLNPEDSMALIHRLGDIPSSGKAVSDIGGRLTALINIGADVNLQDDHGWTALHFHIASSIDSTAIQLLDAGADPSIVDEEGFDSALAAAWNGNVLVLRHIRVLEKQHEEASINWQDLNWERKCNPWERVSLPNDRGFFRWRGCNAAHVASFRGYLGVLAFYLSELGCHRIIEERATVVFPAEKDCRLLPIHIASMAGRTSLVEFLIKQGSDMNALDDVTGWTPLKLALRFGWTSTVKTLIGHGALWLSTDADMLEFAHKYGHEDVIAYVESLEEGEFPATVTRQSNMKRIKTVRFLDEEEPPAASSRQPNLESTKALREELDDAILRGDVEACENLLQQGCSLNESSLECDGCPPLLIALNDEDDYGHCDVIEWLLDNGASTSAVQCPRHASPDWGPQSIPELAARNRKLNPILSSLLSSYLEEGNTWLDQGISPVFAAADGGNTEGLKIILEHVKSEVQKYSARLDIRSTIDEVLRILINQKSGLDMQTPLHIAVAENRIDIVELLLQNGADTRISDGLGDTALHVAVGAGSTGSIHLLLQYGASLEARGQYSQTPLLIAVNNRNLNIVRRLIESGADVTCRDEDGVGPLRYCIEHFKSSTISMMGIYLLLLDSGLDLSSIDGYVAPALVLEILQIPELRCLVISRRISLDGCQPVIWGSGRIDWEEDWWYSFDLVARAVGRQAIRRVLNVRPSEGKSPLSFAAMHGSVEAMRHLVSLEADIEFDDPTYGTPLMVACEYGFLEPVKFLVRLGARLAYGSGNKYHSALHAARKHPHVISWLLVERFRDQPKIDLATYGPGSSEGTQRPRGGVRKLELPLTGIRARRTDESSFDWLVRLREMARSFRGKVPFERQVHVRYE